MARPVVTALALALAAHATLVLPAPPVDLPPIPLTGYICPTCPSTPHPSALLAALLCLIADPGGAQFFDTRYGYNPYGPSGAELALIRGTMIVASTGLGFVVGWFCSPEARVLRQIIGALLVLGAILLIAALRLVI